MISLLQIISIDIIAGCVTVSSLPLRCQFSFSLRTLFFQVQRNACGALRNMVYGRSNADAKSAVGKCGGVSSLAHVLRNTEDQEMRDLITGARNGVKVCIPSACPDKALPDRAVSLVSDCL